MGKATAFCMVPNTCHPRPSTSNHTPMVAMYPASQMWRIDLKITRSKTTPTTGNTAITSKRATKYGSPNASVA